MRSMEIPPFYYPTTVMFVDDSRDFLSNLSLQLDAGLAFSLYDSPNQALGALNTVSNQPSLAERFFSISRRADGDGHHVLDLNLDNVLREVHNEHRFEQVSVVVVDFEMPEINGLEFCKGIKNPAIKKILLTGKAGEKVAVQAFNLGLIDRFIVKQDEDVIPILNRAIVDLQNAYFSRQGRMILDALLLGSHTFLRDQVFAKEFEQICKRLGIVECYLTGAPEGIMMLDANAKATLMIVQTEDGMFKQFESAYELAAPRFVLTELKNNKSVSYLGAGRGQGGADQAVDWSRCLYPATELQGAEPYYYALVPEPTGFPLGGVVSYNTFLTWSDQQGINAASGGAR